MASMLRSERTPWLALASSLLLTLAATAFTAFGVRERDDARFANAVQSAHDRITSRLDIYINTLRSGAALFAAQPDVADDEFHRFVQRLDVQHRYPGIQGVGWSERIAAGLPAAPAETHAIRWLEPLDARNRAAIGYDMYSEPVRRSAMAQARDLGEPAMSGRVVLVQEIYGPRQAGFLIYVPVYRGGGIPASVDERRSLLRGFVYAPFRADDLFAGLFGSEAEPRVSFSVYDGPQADPGLLLHRSHHTADYRPRRISTDTLRMAGRLWTVRYAAEPAFDDASAAFMVPVVLLGGILVSAWIFWLAVLQARARAAAEYANRAKSDFLATMSHELRTPLNAIGGYVDLLDLGIGGSVTGQQREYLSRVQRAQQHLLGLINNILNFAKLGSGGVPFQLADIPLRGVIEEVAAFVAPQVAARRLDFSCPPGPDLLVRADAEKLRQILLNLLSNAVKFTPEGGSISVTWEVHGRHHADIHVTDSGIGIAPEKQDQIFDPFVQVDADLSRTRQGTGLGLAIARELAVRMSGNLSVSSVPGKGSTFTLCLPLARADQLDA